MILSLHPASRVFRRSTDRHNGRGAWHILKKISPNGFTQKSHPEHSVWWDSKTYIGQCGAKYDSRGAPLQEGALEESTVEEIKTICPSCWPYGKRIENYD